MGPLHKRPDVQAALRDVLRTAQGEMALEEFLRQLREHWGGAARLAVHSSAEERFRSTFSRLVDAPPPALHHSAHGPDFHFLIFRVHLLCFHDGRRWTWRRSKGGA